MCRQLAWPSNRVVIRARPERTAGVTAQLVGVAPDAAHPRRGTPLSPLRITRKRRGKAQIHSLLEDIPASAKRGATPCWNHFGSLQKIRAASTEEIAAAPTMNHALAEKLQDYLRVLTKVD
jgi:ERCC4-type nuclease